METKKKRLTSKKKVTLKVGAKPKKASAEAKGAPDLTVPIYDMKGKQLERVQLDQKLFTGEVNKAVLYQYVNMFNANQRGGNASTKTRGDVSGGGKKPWRQKGTGRARAGSIRSPLWPGGGIVFGPHPRDFHFDIPKKMKKVALISGINAKLVDGQLIGLDALTLKEPKTKLFQALLDTLKLKGKSLFVLDAIDDNIRRASRNIKDVCVKHYKDFNTVDVLNCSTMVVSRSALAKLPERCKV